MKADPKNTTQTNKLQYVWMNAYWHASKFEFKHIGTPTLHTL